MNRCPDDSDNLDDPTELLQQNTCENVAELFADAGFVVEPSLLEFCHTNKATKITTNHHLAVCDFNASELSDVQLTKLKILSASFLKNLSRRSYFSRFSSGKPPDNVIESNVNNIASKEGLIEIAAYDLDQPFIYDNGLPIPDAMISIIPYNRRPFYYKDPIKIGIVSITVQDRCQGNGAGRKLIDHAASVAAKNGFGYFMVEFDGSNNASREIFKRNTPEFAGDKACLEALSKPTDLIRQIFQLTDGKDDLSFKNAVISELVDPEAEITVVKNEDTPEDVKASTSTGVAERARNLASGALAALRPNS